LPTNVQHLPKSVQHTKYLYKRKNIYYFSKRINNIPFKISLHSNNLNYCIILRNKILESLKLFIDSNESIEEKMQKINSYLKNKNMINESNLDS